jgi:hypothetical protein
LVPNERHFRRGGPLSLRLLLTLLLLLVSPRGKRGYTLLLQLLWREGRGKTLLRTQTAPSAPAFCNARKKVDPEGIRELVRVAGAEALARRPETCIWRGLRVFAVDGSRLNTQRSADLREKAGTPTGGHNPQVQISVLYALVGEVPLDISVGPYGDSERRQLGEHLELLRAKDLIVLDRGYPSFGLFLDLLARDLHFVLRVATASTFPAVVRFAHGNSDDADIEIAPSRDYREKHRGAELSPVTVRAVRFWDRDGNPVVLLTTLSRESTSRDDIAELYHLRWGVEEHFKLVKSSYFGETQAHAKSFDGVKQEVYAKALYLVITRGIIAHSESVHGTPELVEHRRHDTQFGPVFAPPTRPNVKGVVHAVADTLVRLLLDDDVATLSALVHLLAEEVHRNRVKIRPGRSYPRVSYAPPRSQWTATGKRGDRTSATGG